MKKLKIGHIEVSELALGGGKLVDMPIEEGKILVREALKLGINCFDGHHRYGNANEIFGSFTNTVKMCKISAYNLSERAELIKTNIIALGQIDIFWVSDLDNEDLYESGEKIYNEIKTDFPLVGITTENPQLAMRFMKEHPECLIFIIPVFIGQTVDTKNFIDEAHRREKKIFGIKPFDDGRALKNYTIEQCLRYVKNQKVDVIIMGTTKVEHLKEDIGTYDRRIQGSFLGYNKEYPIFQNDLTISSTHFRGLAYFALPRIGIKKGKLLEIGCSTGRLVKGFRKNGFDAYGVDISPAGISMAPKEVKSYLTVADIQDGIPFEDKSFDIVIGFDIMEHLFPSKLDKVIKEIFRVCKKYILLRIPDKGSDGADYFIEEDSQFEHQIILPREWCIGKFKKHGKFKIHAFPFHPLGVEPWWLIDEINLWFELEE